MTIEQGVLSNEFGQRAEFDVKGGVTYTETFNSKVNVNPSHEVGNEADLNQPSATAELANNVDFSLS